MKIKIKKIKLPIKDYVQMKQATAKNEDLQAKIDYIACMDYPEILEEQEDVINE